MEGIGTAVILAAAVVAPVRIARETAGNRFALAILAQRREGAMHCRGCGRSLLYDLVEETTATRSGGLDAEAQHSVFNA